MVMWRTRKSARADRTAEVVDSMGAGLQRAGTRIRASAAPVGEAAATAAERSAAIADRTVEALKDWSERVDLVEEAKHRSSELKQAALQAAERVQERGGPALHDAAHRGAEVAERLKGR